MYTGSDQKTRDTAVRVCSGKGTIVINRPVQKLYPLEIRAQDDHSRALDYGSDTSECMSTPDTD